MQFNRSLIGLGFLFGTMYFVQGIAEPTEGLVTQPVVSLLRHWGRRESQITTFAALLAIPWSLKPLYGLLTDFVPLAGLRRRSYLIAATGVTTASLALLCQLELVPGDHHLLLVLLIVPTVAVAFTDVVVDALMVETGQPLGITGRLQSIQWAAMYSATILAGYLGGFLTEHRLQPISFTICGALAAVTLILAIFLVREPPSAVPSEGIRAMWPMLWQAARSRAVLGVACFLFLWTFNPFSSAVLQIHMTKVDGPLGFDEQFYGTTISISAVGSLVACLGYGFYCRRLPMTVLVHLSIILGIASTLGYWAVSDRTSALLVSAAVGFTYMTATLIQLDLAAQVCPPRVAGTVFALLMAVSNASYSLATYLGGPLYEHGTQAWGATIAFNLLVGIGALFTAACWLLLWIWPLELRRGATEK